MGTFKAGGGVGERDCYECKHWRSGIYGDHKGVQVNLPVCALASPSKLRLPGRGTPENCPDFEPDLNHPIVRRILADRKAGEGGKPGAEPKAGGQQKPGGGSKAGEQSKPGGGVNAREGQKPGEGVPEIPRHAGQDEPGRDETGYPMPEYR